jgi:hypothetical protein
MMSTLKSAVMVGALVCSSLVAGRAAARPYSEGCFDGKDGNGALNGKTVNGLACQVDFMDKDRSTWGYTDLGQLCNWDPNEELFVHCPLLRTQVSSAEGLNCASSTMIHQNGFQAPKTPCSWLYDTTENSSTRFECVLRSAEESGWFGWWFGWGFDGQPNIKMQEMGGPGKVWQTEWRAHIALSAIANDQYHWGGTYMMSCMLPQLSSCGGEVCLTSLKWFEK